MAKNIFNLPFTILDYSLDLVRGGSADITHGIQLFAIVYTRLVFSFRTFNLNHLWILSQLSYERVLYVYSFLQASFFDCKNKIGKSVQLEAQ